MTAGVLDEPRMQFTRDHVFDNWTAATRVVSGKAQYSGGYHWQQLAGRRAGPVSGIYLRGRGKPPIALTERPYETEDVLRTVLANYPGLLDGDDVGETPRRWVLLSREVGVADQAGAGGRWSLDHLFVHQDAIPTLVDVKRSSDTRIRREVVGQLLEYAANGARYWPVEQLRSLFEAGCAARRVDPDSELSRLRFGPWRAAVGAAGLAANPSSAIAGQTLFEDSPLRGAVPAIGSGDECSHRAVDQRSVRRRKGPVQRPPRTGLRRPRCRLVRRLRARLLEAATPLTLTGGRAGTSRRG